MTLLRGEGNIASGLSGDVMQDSYAEFTAVGEVIYHGGLLVLRLGACPTASTRSAVVAADTGP